MKNPVVALLILLCPLVLNTCEYQRLDIDDFPPIEWEMRYIDTGPSDTGEIIYILFRPSRDFDRSKNIGYYEDYSHTQRAFDTNRLVYINGKSLSGRGGVS
jgi:hypothetical protein